MLEKFFPKNKKLILKVCNNKSNFSRKKEGTSQTESYEEHVDELKSCMQLKGSNFLILRSARNCWQSSKSESVNEAEKNLFSSWEKM